MRTFYYMRYDNEDEILLWATKLEKIFRAGFIQAWVGLVKTKLAHKENPEECVYVRLAKEKFFTSGEKDELKNVLNKLLELL